MKKKLARSAAQRRLGRKIAEEKTMAIETVWPVTNMKALNENISRLNEASIWLMSRNSKIIGVTYVASG